MFSLRTDGPKGMLALLMEGLRLTRQIIDGIVDAMSLFNERYIQATCLLRATRKNHRIIILKDRGCLPIASHIHAGAEFHTLGLHQGTPTTDHGLIKLHIRDAIHQKSTDFILPLKDRDAVTTVIQLIGRSETCRSGPYHCHPLS